ncbi:MAG: LicD family protein [Eubacteriales bacterium]
MDEIFEIRKITTEQIKALQNKSLEILLYFKDFCEKHNLLFYLCGGCCIGAVRHGGFIPWDDDVDVFMPRADYERLYLLWDKEADTERYSICRTTKDVNYHSLVTMIKDNNTAFINRHSCNLDINHGLMLDVIPIDGYPSSVLARKKQALNAMAYSIFNAQRLPDHQGKFIRAISKIILAVVRSPRLKYWIWSRAEKKMTKHDIKDCDYITELCSGYRYLKKKYDKSIFKKAILKEFEGFMLPIPAGYDKYLKTAFGDYTQLPPEEDRTPKHDTVYINLNESYKKYKGIYYLVDPKRRN